MKNNLLAKQINNKLSLFSRKFMLILLLVTTLNAYAGVQNPQAKITLNLKSATVEQFFSAVEKQSGYTFMYNKSILDLTIKKDITAKESTLEEVLSKYMKQYNLSYSVKAGNIVVTKIASTQTKSDKIPVRGRIICVTDNKPIPGAMVMVEGTQIGAIADAKGDFSLNVTQKTGTLVVSCVGYQEQKVSFNEGVALQVKMKLDVMKVDEVQVVAYGAQKTRNVLGAITSVKAKQLEEIPSASLENLLQGHMAGVEVNNLAGSPGGGGTQVQIRGYNSLMNGGTDGSPLYVIDGVPVSSFTSPLTGTNTLAEIDPSTIESVEVLKDAASAAIYGSRASNGVILITTKQGKSGRGKFSVNFSQSFSMLPETPVQLLGNAERQIHIMNGRSMRESYSLGNVYIMPGSYEDIYGVRSSQGAYDYFWNKGEKKRQNEIDYHLQDSLNPFYNNATNWWKYCFRPGLITNANVQTSGGTDLIQYLVGGGYYGERGIMVGSDFKRVNLISNLSVTPRKDFKVDARIYLAYTDRSKGAVGGGTEIEGLTVDPRSNSSLIPGGGEIEKKTLEKINETSEKNTSIRLRSSVMGKYTIISGLDISSNIAIDYTSATTNGFIPSYLDARDHLSMVDGATSSTSMLTNENLIHYNKKIADSHSFDVLLGHSFMRQSTSTMSGHGRGGPSDKLHYVVEGFPEMIEINGVATPMKTFRSDFEEKIMISYFGRMSYNFKEKYLAEVTVRHDGSSTFGENVRWATFPSVAAGWTFSEEKFMKNLYWVDFAKFRGSWGRSGQTFSKAYLAHGLLGIGNTFLGNPGMEPMQVLNTNLTWEETDQYNIGFDFYLLEQRLRVKTDYYYKYSKSLLWSVPLPGNVYGHDKSLQNVMEISNEGFEFEIVYDVLRESRVKWRTKFNISTNKNRFEKSYTDMDMLSGTGQSALVLGRPIHSIYAYQDNGYFQSQSEIPMYYDQKGNAVPLYDMTKARPFMPGMRNLEDVNMDGKIDNTDMIYTASTLPVAFGGWANELMWKNFDLNVLFTYTIGRKMINGYGDGSLKFKGGTRWDPILTDYRGASFWEKEGDMSDYPTLVGSRNTGQFDGTYASKIENVSYVRLKQLTLGYNLSKDVVKKIGIEGIRFFVTAENLFLLSNYSGIDPETVGMDTGYDNFDNYPLARKITLGLTVKF